MLQRDPNVTALLRWLTPNPNLSPSASEVAGACQDLAVTIVAAVPDDDPELEAGLRHLLEAKDAFVRAVIAYERRLADGRDE